MISQALFNLRPGETWYIKGDETYANIVWTNIGTEMPSSEEVATEVARIETEKAQTAYRKLRARAYPPIGDQLDALWKGGDAAAEMLARVQAVKDQYPKPEEM